MTPDPFHPSRRELIRWAAATSVLSAVPLFGCGSPAQPPAPWKPSFLTPDEVETLNALADSVLPPEADGTGGGRALGTAVFVDRLMTALDGAPKLHAEGPYSNRQPFADTTGVPSTRFSADQFNEFASSDPAASPAERPTRPSSGP